MTETEKLLNEASAADLRLVLISSRLSTKGKKEELIKRISENCSEEIIRKYLENPRYTNDVEYNSLKELSRRLKLEKKLMNKKRN